MKTHRQHSMLTISCYSLLSHSCVILCDPLNGSTPGFPVLNYLQRLLKLIRVESVMPSGHLILCSPLLLLPSIFPSIRVFSSESALCIRWLKFWSFSFSNSPSNEYSGLVSFRIDWFDLAVQRTLKSLLQHHNMKVSWAFKVVGSSRTSPLQLLAISYL